MKWAFDDQPIALTLTRLIEYQLKQMLVQPLEYLTNNIDNSMVCIKCLQRNRKDKATIKYKQRNLTMKLLLVV